MVDLGRDGAQYHSTNRQTSELAHTLQDRQDIDNRKKLLLVAQRTIQKSFLKC